ncbi:MAG: hypothetical protein HY319_21315 [Armatimonadetes bacterium]|nr:hypothetical protein [Armatimonadota bacterium]
MSRPELEACLEGLHSGGELDSSGAFTLTREKAVEKLRSFRLAEPRLYVLNLLAAAVAGGAGRIEIECDSDDFVLTAPGISVSLYQLRELESHMLSEGSPALLRELGVGFYGAQALRPQRIVVEARTPDRGLRICWRAGRLEEEEVPAGPAALTVRVREKVGLRTAGKWIARCTGATRPDSEEDAIARHCNLAPVPVLINGNPLVRPLSAGNVEASIGFRDDAPLNAGHPLSQLFQSTRLQALLQPTGGPFRGFLCLGGRLGPWLTLVVHGVSFRVATRSFPARGVRGIVYADHLHKDLSQTRVVQDSAFLELMDRLFEFCRSWLAPRGGAHR